jgi:hypothetical protein
VPVSTRFFRFGSGFPSQNASAAELSQRPSSALPCEIALANVRTAASTCAFVSDPDATASGGRDAAVLVPIPSRSSCSFQALAKPT